MAIEGIVDDAVKDPTGALKVASLPDSGSVEQVAYNLMHDIQAYEADMYKDWPRVKERKYVLDLYAECREAARGGRRFERS